MSASTEIPLEERLISAHGYASLAGILVSALFGLAVALKFNAPDFLGQASWVTWGRLRFDHTQGILYGWLGNLFLAFLYYAVPYLTRRPITNVRLGWVIFVLWNFVAVPAGWTLVLAGVNQPLEWAEFPLVVAVAIELAWVLLIWQFVMPFLKCGASEIYVAGWYILGAITFTALAYPVGNIAPNLLPGAMGAAFSGLWIHDAVGLFVTPFGVAIAYFVIPAVTGRPIYSHFYSMVGFWLLFLVYPLNGIHHYLYSSLPMSAQHAAEVASIYQGIDVILVVTNLLISIPIARAAQAFSDVPLRFIWTSIVLYLIVSLQGSLQAVMSFNRYVHFSDWVIGHSHLAMIGFASFAGMGGLAHIWQRLSGVRFHPRLLAYSYWLLVIGLALMVVDLTAAGLVQASLWQAHLPWLESVRASRPYWLFRSLDGVLLVAGFATFAGSLVLGPIRQVNPAKIAILAGDELPKADNWINTAYATTFGAGLLFFVVSFIALGVIPAVLLHAEMIRTTPPGVSLKLTPQELRGREIYAKNGCGYCHSQQVRDLAVDVRRFGPPTLAWETANELPQLWGTRRIGPDLAREGVRRTADWQTVHLYNPRYIVPDSIMPAYAWMFSGGPEFPAEEAVDVVAYLQSLGRMAALRMPEPEPRDAQRPTMPAPPITKEGRDVFAANCSGCHGMNGKAGTPGGRALRPAALNLTAFEMTDAIITSALAHGVRGSSMSSWDDLPADQLNALWSYAVSLESSDTLPQTEMLASPEILHDAGYRVYETHCTRCHGETGASDGPDAAKRLPLPAKFTEVRPSYAIAAKVIHDGVPGSAMEAWPLLTTGEIQAVTFYLRGFYKGPDRHAVAPASSPAVTMEDHR
jgi:cytochrome c oxidase cbb3-type subunit I/II